MTAIYFPCRSPLLAKPLTVFPAHLLSAAAALRLQGNEHDRDAERSTCALTTLHVSPPLKSEVNCKDADKNAFNEKIERLEDK